MAKNDNLTDYLTDLADGIRAKKGTTDPINPQDFRAEIESISGGGADSGGLRCFKVNNPNNEFFGFFAVHLMQLIAIDRIDQYDTPTGVGVEAGVHPSIAALVAGSYDLVISATKGFALYDSLCYVQDGIVFSFDDFINIMISISVSELLEACELEEITVDEFIKLV